VSYQNDRIRLVVSVPSGGYLVLSEVFAPGWSATVDGQPAELLRANAIFRALWVAPGEHQVELRYWPTLLTLGAASSGVAWLGVNGLWLLALGRVWSNRSLTFL
jgi:uncharacterized membrane protein YfhO